MSTYRVQRIMAPAIALLLGVSLTFAQTKTVTKQSTQVSLIYPTRTETNSGSDGSAQTTFEVESTSQTIKILGFNPKAGNLTFVDLIFDGTFTMSASTTVGSNHTEFSVGSDLDYALFPGNELLSGEDPFTVNIDMLDGAGSTFSQSTGAALVKNTLMNTQELGPHTAAILPYFITEGDLNITFSSKSTVWGISIFDSNGSVSNTTTLKSGSLKGRLTAKYTYEPANDILIYMRGTPFTEPFQDRLLRVPEDTHDYGYTIIGEILSFTGSGTIEGDGYSYIGPNGETDRDVSNGADLYPDDIIKMNAGSTCRVKLADGRIIEIPAITGPLGTGGILQFKTFFETQPSGQFSILKGVLLFVGGLMELEKTDDIKLDFDGTIWDYRDRDNPVKIENPTALDRLNAVRIETPHGSIGIRGSLEPGPLDPKTTFASLNTDYGKAAVITQASPVTLSTTVTPPGEPTTLSFDCAFLSGAGELTVRINDFEVFKMSPAESVVDMVMHVDVAIDDPFVYNLGPAELSFTYDGGSAGDQLIIDNVVFDGIENGNFSDDDAYWFAKGKAELVAMTFPDDFSEPVLALLDVSGELDFGSVAVGQSATRTLTLVNNRGADITVTSLTLPVGYTANWSGGVIPSSGSREVTITFSPIATGTYDGALTIASTANGVAGTNGVPVSGEGTGSSDPRPNALLDSVNYAGTYYFSSWFGGFFTGSERSPFLFTDDFGWVYIDPSGTSAGMWWWSYNMGSWLWGSEATGRNFYRAADNTWIYVESYQGGGSSIFNYSTLQWSYLAP